ncbi:MAG: protein kinase [Syntrophomonadaceae bacterium]|nr:protein kinase [Syntrophomonadaceae bacterium]
MNGTTLGGRYELIEIVGEGGMSTVFKARDKILDRIVAVKILKDEFSKDKGFVEKFKTEALSAASISHPNIVNIYDVGQEQDVHYIVMEYVDGTTLKDIIRKRAPLPVEEAVNIAIMVCDGVHHAHEKGIIHRDIKPHNILITEQGMVKVADFGIARAVSAGTITYGNNIVGSVHYFSPEQARGEVINRTTDIYSIGCILYEMVTGKVPFDAESPITVALRHIHDDPPSPRLKNPEIPVALEGIIFRAMEKVPGRRFQTAQDMRNALLNISRASTIAGPERDVDKVKKRKLKPAGIALIAIALLGLLSGVMFMMGGNLFGKEVVVPDIVGMNMAQAEAELDKLCLVMNVIAKQNDPNVEKDLIISQDPGKDRKVKAGRQIDVVVSAGSEQVKVPNIVGVTVKEATTRLANKGLNLGTPQEVYDEKYEAGIIISQDPLADTNVDAGTNVAVVVSKGKSPNKISMPDLKGLSLTDATKKLQDNKLVLGQVSRQTSNNYFKDQVSNQDTAPGVLVDEGTTVNITLSNGPGPTTKTKRLRFELPDDQQYYNVVITVKDAQNERVVYNVMHRAGEEINVGINYTGTGTAQVQLNGEPSKTYSLP